MKVKILIPGLAIVATMNGCADQQIRRQNYQDYLEKASATNEKYIDKVASTPLVDIKLPAPDGKEYHIKVNQQIRPVAYQQIKADESYRFWGQVLSATVPTVGNVTSSLINAHYNYKSTEAMWSALTDGGFGGIKFNSGGGDISLVDSANPLEAALSGTGNSLAFQGYGYMPSFGEGASQVGNSTTPENQENYTTNTTQNTTKDVL